MLYIIIVILAVLLLLLSARMLMIKREMKRISSEMKKNGDDHPMNVVLIDTDLQDMILEVNRLYKRVISIQTESKEEKKAIRESISMISHDMRTPLTSVIGYLQIAQRTDDTDEMKKNTGIALERAVYLNRLINDFFELSLIESGQITSDTHRVELCGIVCEEILAETPELERRNILPDFAQADDNIYVSADEKMLTRVVQNLISNAVRYSDGILRFVIDTEDERVSLHITSSTDTKPDTDRIFDRFYREDRSRSGGGTGLGLYICRSFAESMGGTITAKQDDNLFTVILTLRTDNTPRK